MHFLDAWSALSLFDLVRLLAPLGFLAVGTFLPGAAVARVAALGVAAGVPFLKELAAPPWVVAVRRHTGCGCAGRGDVAEEREDD